MKNATLTPDQLRRKTDLARLLQCSTRQIEIMVKDGRLPRPLYFGTSSPRWRKTDIDEWLERLAREANSHEPQQ